MEEAFLKAYEDCADAIFRHCFFHVRQDRELAKDLTQETFIKTWKYIAEGNNIENIRAFLYKTATHLIIDHSRKRTHSSLDTLQEEGFEPSYSEEEKFNIRLDAKKAERYIDQLEDPYRQILIMRYIDDLSPKEIAKFLHENTNVVSVRIHRALKKIRKLMPTEL